MTEKIDQVAERKVPASSYCIDPVSAEFEDPAVEREYRTFIRDVRVRDTQKATGLSAILYLLFAWTDFMAMEGQAEYVQVLGARVLVAMIAIMVALLAKRFWYLLVNGVLPTLVVTVGMLALLSITLKRPYEIGWHGMSMMIMLIGTYVFIPNRFMPALVVAIASSLAFLWLAVIHFQPSFDAVVTLMLLLLVVNILGAISAYRASRLQHEAFRHVAIQQEANDVLAQHVQQRESLEAELRNMAEQDALTGLPSRHHFFSQAEACLEEALDSGIPLCLLMIDVDYFRQINGTYGHVRGDALLKGLAEVCRSHVRPIDICGRLGGEEFGIILPGLELHEAGEYAEKLRVDIQRSPVDLKDAGLNCTVSIGVAPLHPGESITALLRRADQALLAAKYRGRNRIELAAR